MSSFERDPDFLDDLLFRVPPFVYFLLMVPGGLIGYFYALHYGYVPKQGAFWGAVIGLLFLPLLVVVVRFAIIAAVLAAVALVIYYVFYV